MSIKSMLILGLVVIGLCAVARIARFWHPRPDPKVRLNEYTVVEAESSTSLIVRLGILERSRRTATLQLDGVTGASDSTLAVQGKENLQRLAGTTVRVETPAGLFRSEQDEKQVMEAKVIHGKVFGESGCCLQIEQLKAGLVTTVGKVSADYTAAQKEAKKNKVGVWSKQ